MKKALCQVVAMCLTIAMLLSFVTVFAFATSGTCGNGLTWELKNGKLTVTGSGAMDDYSTENKAPWFEDRFSITEIEIGDGVTTIGKYAFYGLEKLVTANCGKVDSIGDFAFYCCPSIDSVTFAEGLTRIGEGAFANCLDLSQVQIPDSVVTIGNGAFMGTVIEGDLIFGNNLKSIGIMAFYMCYGITGITIPDSVVAIGEGAFFGCEFVEDVTIGKNVAYIGDMAFAYCTDLKSFTVASGNTAYKSVDGILLTYDMETLIAYPIDKAERATVPSTVKKIASAAFAGGYIITSIELPEGLEVIDAGAFTDCWYLEGIELPSSLTNIGDSVFASDFIMQELTIPANVSAIGVGAFRDMFGIKKFVVEDGNEHFIARDGVLYSSDGTVLLACPNGMSGTFTVPSTVNEIAPYAFAGCYQLDVVLSEGLKVIGDGAFNGCGSKAAITIPASVEYIGEAAFADSKFKSINVASGNTIYTSVDGVLFTKDMTRLISYPGGKSAENYIVPDGVVEIGDCAFKYSLIKSVTISNSVQKIGDYAFDFCENLTEVNVGSGIKEIGSYAFSDSNITKIELPRGLESVGSYAFAWCYDLKSVTFAGVTYIDQCAFYWCGELNTVEFKSAAPSNVGDMAFRGCSDNLVITYVEGMKGWTTPTWMGYNTSGDGKTDVIIGDVNGDGKVSNSDLVRLARYLVEIGEIVEAAGDVDGNGRVSNADLVRLSRILVDM